MATGETREMVGRAAPMTIDCAGIPGQLLAEYARIPIAFKVRSVLTVSAGIGPPFATSERRVASPYVKDYDAIAPGPLDWPTRFDTSQWAMFLAREDGRAVGGATVMSGDDGALLWDIRVVPECRSRGVGRALLETVESWARARGCRELKVETQDVNVPACRFYAAMGCELRVVRVDAYPDCPGEVQLLWSKVITPSPPPREPLGTEHTSRGQVKWWRDAKGYGVIATADTAPWDIWCHFSAVEGEGFRVLQPGQTVEVEYVRLDQESFKYIARRVRVIE